MKKIKQIEKKLKHNCPSCLATYTLLETHLTRKDLTKCQLNCLKVWQELIFQHCQEKVLAQELIREQEGQEPASQDNTASGNNLAEQLAKIAKENK